MKLVTIPSLLILALLAQAPQQTPAQILDQISALLQQLKTALGAPVPPDPTPVPTPTPAPTATQVTDGVGLTKALLAGGTIQVAPGLYVGNFKISVSGTTVTGPTGSAAELKPADVTLPVLSTVGPVQNFTVSHFTVDPVDPGHEVIVIGDPIATTTAAQPAHGVLDSITLDASAQGGHRGIALHGTDLTVRNSHLAGLWRVGQDSQAIWINNGPGPYAVLNNYLEASGETVLVGGDSVHIPNVVPSNITISGNTLVKPNAWRTNGSTVKNAIEIKIGLHVVIANNTIDGNWVSGQDGTPILLTVRNQNNDNPWALVDDVTIRNNVTKHCVQGFAVSILGSDDTSPSQQTQTVSIVANLFSDSPGGLKLGNGVATALVVDHNTLPAIGGNFLSFYDTRATPVKTPLTFTNNVTKSGNYGISSAAYVVGTPTLMGWTSGLTFTGNVIELTGQRTIAYPAGNQLVAPGGLAALLDPVTFKLLGGTAGY
jgi:hypothetical protein